MTGTCFISLICIGMAGAARAGEDGLKQQPLWEGGKGGYHTYRSGRLRGWNGGLSV
jgi:hypothetical protein